MNNLKIVHSTLQENNLLKTYYQITSQETKTVVLKRRKVAKALRWWLRENGYPFTHIHFVR